MMLPVEHLFCLKSQPESGAARSTVHRNAYVQIRNTGSESGGPATLGLLSLRPEALRHRLSTVLPKLILL